MFWHKIKHNLNHQTKPKIKMPDNYFTQDGMAGHELAMTMNHFVETDTHFPEKKVHKTLHIKRRMLGRQIKHER